MKPILWLWVLAALFTFSCKADRTIVGFNGIPVGDTCSTDADCGGVQDACCTGGKCGPEGLCSPKCDSDQDCPQDLLGDWFCIDRDGKRCFEACVNDSDCATDFICEDKDGHKTCRYK
jgi:hypothetical protein